MPGLRDTEGNALVAALIALVLLAGMTAASLTLATADNDRGGATRSRDRAVNAAVTGLQDVTDKLRRGQAPSNVAVNCATATGTVTGEADDGLTAAQKAADPGYQPRYGYTITQTAATASIEVTGCYRTYTAKRTAKMQIAPTAYHNALYSLGAVVIDNSFLLLPAASRAGGAPLSTPDSPPGVRGGDLHTNASVTMTGASSINSPCSTTVADPERLYRSAFTPGVRPTTYDASDPKAFYGLSPWGKLRRGNSGGADATVTAPNGSTVTDVPWASGTGACSNHPEIAFAPESARQQSVGAIVLPPRYDGATAPNRSGAGRLTAWRADAQANASAGCTNNTLYPGTCRYTNGDFQTLLNSSPTVSLTGIVYVENTSGAGCSVQVPAATTLRIDNGALIVVGCHFYTAVGGQVVITKPLHDTTGDYTYGSYTGRQINRWPALLVTADSDNFGGNLWLRGGTTSVSRIDGLVHADNVELGTAAAQNVNEPNLTVTGALVSATQTTIRNQTLIVAYDPVVQIVDFDATNATTLGSWSPVVKNADGTLDRVNAPSSCAGFNGVAAANRTLGPYAALIMNDGPAAYWRFNETTGNTACDETGQLPNGYRNTPTLGLPGALVRQPSRAMHAADSAHASVVAGPAFPSTAADQSYSGEIWVRLEAGADPTSRYVLRCQNPGGISIGGWRLITNGNIATSRYQFTFNSGSGTYAGALGPSGSAGTVGVWSHLVFTFTAASGGGSGGTARFYINGALVATTTVAAHDRCWTTTAMFVGHSAVDHTVDEILDETAFYPYALTATQVARHYEAR